MGICGHDQAGASMAHCPRAAASTSNMGLLQLQRRPDSWPRALQPPSKTRPRNLAPKPDHQRYRPPRRRLVRNQNRHGAARHRHDQNAIRLPKKLHVPPRTCHSGLRPSNHSDLARGLPPRDRTALSRPEGGPESTQDDVACKRAQRKRRGIVRARRHDRAGFQDARPASAPRRPAQPLNRVQDRLRMGRRRPPNPGGT